MSLSLKDFEIMAPVGSRESLAAAIQAGADSIYFGIENLNMRARSANTFTIDGLCPPDRAGGASFHPAEYLQCRSVEILCSVC